MRAISVEIFARRLAETCAREEGFYVTAQEAAARRIKYPTAAQRHNNPGNLMDLEYYQETEKFRLQTYETVGEGVAAAEAWWVRRIRAGKTLREAIHRYAPRGHGDNNPDAYTAMVAKALAIPEDVPLNELTESEITK